MASEFLDQVLSSVDDTYALLDLSFGRESFPALACDLELRLVPMLRSGLCHRPFRLKVVVKERR